jgi:hypothetical protein
VVGGWQGAWAKVRSGSVLELVRGEQLYKRRGRDTLSDIRRRPVWWEWRGLNLASCMRAFVRALCARPRVCAGREFSGADGPTGGRGSGLT